MISLAKSGLRLYLPCPAVTKKLYMYIDLKYMYVLRVHAVNNVINKKIC